MGRLYEAELRACVQNGVEYAADTQYLGSETTDRGSVISLEFKGIRYRVAAKVLVGSDGAASRVAKDLQLDENREWIVGYEQVFRSRGGGGEARLHCFLNARLAPGYLAWIADDGDEMHIGVGGYAAKFSPKAALNEFRDNIAARFVDLQGAEPAETRGGRIPVGGVLRRIANERGLLVGDAAGAVSPLTAGGLDPCLRLSAIAADVIAERLRSGDPRVLLKYSGELFRTRFTSRLWMRRLISAFSSQTALEIGCMLLRSRAGAAFAGHVFFGRGSFPDVELGRERSGAGNAMGFLDR
jgi:flavin-dependent dehydrogenase